MATDLNPRRRSFTFTIRTAFIAILLLSALLASYRAGVENGLKRGQVVPASFGAHTLYVRDYDISDIVKSKSDADMLLNSLRATAEPESWDVIGGYAESALNPNASVLTITQIGTGHALVVQYLTDVRDSATERNDLAGVLKAAESIYNARHKMDGRSALQPATR